MLVSRQCGAVSCLQRCLDSPAGWVVAERKGGSCEPCRTRLDPPLSLVLGVALFIAIRAGHMNNWHSIALTVSSPPWSTRRLDIERTSTSFTLLGVVVLASLTLVQPRHASKESKTKQEFEHFTKIQVCRAWRPLPADLLTWKWRLDAWEFKYLPLPGSEAKSSNLMFYEGKKSMSMISWSRKGTQANWALFIYLYILYCIKYFFSFYFLL